MSRVSHPPRSFPTPCMQDGKTALHYGAENGAGEPIMRLLLERKADVNAKDMVPRGVVRGWGHGVELVHGGSCVVGEGEVQSGVAGEGERVKVRVRG